MKTILCPICGEPVIPSNCSLTAPEIHKGFCNRISEYTTFTRQGLKLLPRIHQKMEQIVHNFKSNE